MSDTPPPSTKRTQNLRRVSLLTRTVAAASVGLTGLFAYLAAAAHPASNKASVSTATNTATVSNSSGTDSSTSATTDDESTTATTETPIQSSTVHSSSSSSGSITSGQS